MSIDNDWLLENLSGSYSLGAVDDAVDSLIGEYELLMGKIDGDKRNYMMEAVSTMKEKIITSRVENVLELIDSTQFTDGDEFRTIGTGLTIVARKYMDGETGTPAWTIAKIYGEMEDSFEPIEKIETVAVQEGYSSAANVVVKRDLVDSRDTISKTSDEVLVPFAEIGSVSLADNMSIINVDDFIKRYIPSITEGQIDLIKLTVDTSLKSIKLSVCDVSFVEHLMSDGELKGSGSKLTDYSQISDASPASNYEATLHVILNYANDYTVNVGGVDYVYSATDFETAEDIAAGLEGELGGDANLNISTDIGYWSTVFENGNSDRVFGWYAENEDDSVSYEVEMIVPVDVSDFMVEQDGLNPEKILITFEHDGFDPVYPTIADIRDAVNAFGDVDIRVVVMPGFSDGDEYSTADSFTLDHGASKVIISSGSDQTITMSSLEASKTKLTHISDFSAASSQVGAFEVMKFNPTNTYFVDIDGIRVDIDPTTVENESVIDEATLAQRFVTLINDGGLASTASISGAVVTLTATISGDSFVVTTSGEFDYVEPTDRDTLLRYDVRNLPNVNTASIGQLRKAGSVITDMGEPLNKLDVDRLSTSGVVFSDTAMMCPQVPSLVDETNGFVPKISRSSIVLEKTVSANKSNIGTAQNLVAPVVRSMAKMLFPIYSTDQAKSNRWFFVEAGANSIAAKSAIGVALSTVSPRDFERLVLQDENATFATARDSRLPNVGQKYESITGLLTEKVASYNAVGKKALLPIRSDIIAANALDVIEDFMSNEQIDGFIKYALLPQIVSGLGFIDTEKNETDISKILTDAGYILSDVSTSSSLKTTIHTEDLGLDLYTIRDLFVGTRYTVLIVDDEDYVATEVRYQTVYGFNIGMMPQSIPVNVEVSYPSSRIVIYESITDNFIAASDATGLYKALMELAIQIDDALREQRFIALAGAYVIDASSLLDMYSDEVFADFVFGVNEAETPPEGNYGIGGIPIDATVTMSKLYFRNMRNQALPYNEKRYALGSAPTIGELILYMVPSISLTGIASDIGYSWSVKMNDRVMVNSTLEHVTLDEGGTISTDNDFKRPISVSTSVEDKLYKEIARSGYFSSNVDLGINHAATGLSSRFKDSIWSLLMDAVEIADDGSIISLNSARSYIQALYQSFELMSEEQFTGLLLKPSVYFELGSIAEVESIYSPIVTLYLKILLYLKEKKGSILYQEWEQTFNSVVGLLFMDDEFEENILSYELFLAWIGGIGAHTAFSWSDDIQTDIDVIYASAGMDSIVEDKIFQVQYIEDNNSDNTGVVPEAKVGFSFGTILTDKDLIVPSFEIETLNTIPVANAGTSTSQTGVGTVQLDGSNSADADGDDITYEWTMSSRPTASTAELADSTVVNPTFVVDEDGDYVIDLVVRDQFSTSLVNSVTVTKTT